MGQTGRTRMMPKGEREREMEKRARVLFLRIAFSRKTGGAKISKNPKPPRPTEHGPTEHSPERTKVEETKRKAASAAPPLPVFLTPVAPPPATRAASPPRPLPCRGAATGSTRTTAGSLPAAFPPRLLAVSYVFSKEGLFGPAGPAWPSPAPITVSSRRTPASLSDTASSRATTLRSATCESLNPTRASICPSGL
jgi:hypothetical protein